MDVPDKLLPETIEENEPIHVPELKRFNENCLNCGTSLIDDYCHHCGQKDLPQRQTILELLKSFVSSFWSFEGKFFRSTYFLITKPGFLSEEYNLGKRESYFHPARMYVFISFVFFFLFFNIPGNEPTNKVVTIANADNSKVDSAKIQTNFNLTGNDYKTVQQYETAQKKLPESEKDNWISRHLNIRIIELINRYENKPESFGSDISQAFLENISKVIFFLLPVFALLLQLLYVKRNFFFSEHLIFTIYYYNFVYLAGTFIILFGLLPWFSWLNIFVLMWIALYLLFAMKRIYLQSWKKTIFKFLTLGFFFSICLILAFLINLFWQFFVI